MRQISACDIAKIRKAIKLHPVNLCYIFGSALTPYFHEESDVDIAVLLKETSTKESRFDTRLRLMENIGAILKRKVDVVVLNDVSAIFFLYIIIKEGKLIFKISFEGQADFEMKVLNQYFDFQPFLIEYDKHYVEAGIAKDSR